jgi:thiol:disulfide interchange protein/DsbC/DsbD-like thiol-disulfide interchange protein
LPNRFEPCLICGFLLLLWGVAQAQTQVLGGPAANKAKGQVVSTGQVQATLQVYAPKGLVAGETFWLGLQIQHQPQWHTYWRNPGDSGLATELQWQLPDGLTSGNIIWPAPQKIPVGSMANYGYEGSVLLVTPVQVGPKFKASASETDITVQLRASWLVCKQECIPQEGEFLVRVPVKGSTVTASEAFQAALSNQAQSLKGNHSAVIAEDGRTLTLKIDALPPELSAGAWTIYPQTANVMRNSAAPSIQANSVTMPISSERMDSPQRMAWLLVQGTASAPTGKQWVFETPVQGKWQEWTEAPAVYNASQFQLSSVPAAISAAPWATWMLAVLGAFLGGMLLNFMPCVFPVLAIKLLGITQHSGNQRTMRLSAWAFSVGVLISFLLLGGLMLAFRAAGAQMGWGFQLQSPWVVGALAFLFIIMGLNLSGLFQFGHFVPSSVASFQFANPATNSLWSGVFAVVIASPCTAPFMGASLGLAIGFPAWQALPIFGAMGLGMALPFLLVSISSSWLKFLPKPGAWMNTFRHVMAVPMYATAIWLVWVLGLQTGWWDNAQTQAPSATSASQGDASRPAIVWEAWSEDKVSAARKEGRPVFIDFTAAWCVTCQFNKKTTFADAKLLEDFAQKNVLLLRADWTRYDPAITKALNQLGRNGLPVYAWYAPGQEVLILSELPSVQEVQNALSQVKSAP